MRNPPGKNAPQQGSLFGVPRQTDMFEEAERALLDQLLSEARLYTRSKDYKELLDFVARLRGFAPFNAMLLQVQKPGLTYAASAIEWRERFGRTIKDGARPLLILWPFAPVALVYDILDTEGPALPESVRLFAASGPVDRHVIERYEALLAKKNIAWVWVDAGDGYAGSVQRLAGDAKAATYKVRVNKNHSPAVQFSTLVHELGHLFLGHLGQDKRLKIPLRGSLTKAQKEIEAESVAYIVCTRNGVSCSSHAYLADYVKRNSTIDDVDVYQVMRAAGQVESLLELTAYLSAAKRRA